MMTVPTNQLRFVKRSHSETVPGQPNNVARTVTRMILQQRWCITEPTGDCNACGHPIQSMSWEWRDVPVEDE